MWLSQAQMVELFGRDVSVISRHISNALDEGEVTKKSNLQKMQIANSDRPVIFYDLDVVISVGYRIKSERGVQFRRWGSNVLRQHLVRGYAFYTAVANNESAKQLMRQDKLRELAVVLTQRVCENASIDCTIKENVKAKLKAIVKRTLCQYGYPPDMQLLATETVLKQAEMIADELAG